MEIWFHSKLYSQNCQIKDSLIENTQLYADRSADFQVASTISTDVAFTMQRPDLVAFRKSQHKVITFGTISSIRK